MTIREEMHSLVQDIMGAHEARAADIGTLRQEVNTQKHETQDWLREVGKTYNAMAQQKRADLAKGRSDLAHEEIQRKAEIHDLMKRISTDHAEARAEWQDMAITLQTKNGTARAASKTRVDGKGIAEQIASWSNRVFDYLTNHPGGSRLAEIEGEFKLKRFEAAGIIKHLRNGGKVEKRDLLYFAVEQG